MRRRLPRCSGWASSAASASQPGAAVSAEAAGPGSNKQGLGSRSAKERQGLSLSPCMPRNLKAPAFGGISAAPKQPPRAKA